MNKPLHVKFAAISKKAQQTNTPITTHTSNINKLKIRVSEQL